MAIRDNRWADGDDNVQRMKCKANQEWELAGCARQDDDKHGEKKHTDSARNWERQINDYLGIVPNPIDPKHEGIKCPDCKGKGCWSCNYNGLDPAAYFRWSNSESDSRLQDVSL